MEKSQMDYKSAEQNSSYVDQREQAKPFTRLQSFQNQHQHRNDYHQSQTNSNFNSFIKCLLRFKWLFCFLILLILVISLQSLDSTINQDKIQSPIQKRKYQEQATDQQVINLEKVQKQQKPQEPIQEYCKRAQKLIAPVFFIYLDKQDLSPEQAHDFIATNQITCKFYVLYQVDLEYLVYMWNSREQTITYTRQLINITSLSKQNKKSILIFLQQYFWGGIYLHASFGVKFQHYINDRFYNFARIGKQILFGEIDHENEKGILLPKRNFKASKVEQKYSEQVERIIRKIIAGQDWMQVCSEYQCIIMKNSIRYP